jgi:hypothetical protein
MIEDQRPPKLDEGLLSSMIRNTACHAGPRAVIHSKACDMMNQGCARPDSMKMLLDSGLRRYEGRQSLPGDGSLLARPASG